jgi:hypothetical protein
MGQPRPTLSWAELGSAEQIAALKPATVITSNIE